MALFGTSALAMWWDIAPDVLDDFEHWHAHEHFPERLSIPGFRRGTRWSNASGGGMFVLYEIDDHAVLSSPAYLARLNAPTPWSTRLMPHHVNMVRSQCRVVASRGGGIARHAVTVRVSSTEGADERLDAYGRSLVESLPTRPGLTGAHFLVHEDPRLAPTTEQRIRNTPDRVADRVLVVCGYDSAALRALPDTALSDATLVAQGAHATIVRDTYTLSCSAIATDVT